MVASRAANTHHTPSVKDILASSSRAMSQRVSELPSLSFRERFGMTPIPTPMTTPMPTQAQQSGGPLRVTVHLGATPAAPPRRFSTRYMRSFTDDLSVATSRESRGTGGRRVRFELPPPVSPLFACDSVTLLHNTTSSSASGGGAAKLPSPVAGVDSWLRSRLGTANTYQTALQSATPTHATPRTTPATTTTTASRVHDTGRYRRGTLAPTSNAAPPGAASPGTLTLGAAAILKAAKDADEKALLLLLQDGGRHVLDDDVNAVDVSGRTAASHVASHGSLPMLEALIEVPGFDVNKADNDGNTPLHYASQAGHADAVNYILTHCAGVKVDARNVAGITPLMKAALQGRNRCAKLLIIGGASPTLKDGGKGLRPDEWARHCGRYVCSEMIVKMSRHRYVDRWGSEPDLDKASSAHPKLVQQSHSYNSFTNKLKHALWTRGSSKANNSSSSLVTHLTTAALCASTPAMPSKSAGGKSLIRPLVVPRLLVTPAMAADSSTEEPNHVVPVPEPRTSTGKHSRQLYFKSKK